MKKSAKKGFTLIELIIVIAILGILAAVLIPKISGVKANAQVGVNRTNSKQIQSALAQYYADNDGYPLASDYNKAGGALDKGMGATDPTFKNGTTKIIQTYTPAVANGSSSANSTYTIVFNDDPGTSDVNEASGVLSGSAGSGTATIYTLTPGTDTNKLWK